MYAKSYVIDVDPENLIDTRKFKILENTLQMNAFQLHCADW